MKEIPVKHKVDKGVPIPVNTRGLPLASLKVGESIQFPVSDRPKVATQASTLKKQTSLNFTIHKEDNETARIWRTE